jgi:PIN domain nuclease of toxin-antitoxin system
VIRLLLDTHVFLWWCADSPRLGDDVRHAIAAPRNQVLVSAASAWEMAIKSALGRLHAPGDVESAVDANGFQKLEISFAHTARAGELPPRHGDPFDRMLVAQAEVEGLTLVTHDRRLEPYGLQILWT